MDEKGIQRRRNRFNLKVAGAMTIILLVGISTALAYRFGLGPFGKRQASRIGMVQKTFVDSGRDRSLETHIWYPAPEAEGKEWGGNRVFDGMFATKNTEIMVTEKAPLYILVHGTYGSWRNMVWLADDLVEQGGIVVAADHPGSTWGDITPESILQTWNQPEDVSFLIDSMLDSEYGSFIDEENIVVIGFSLGGYSALAVSGATLELERLPVYCESSEEEVCDLLEPAFELIDEKFIARANQNYVDDRIKAAVALAPGFVALMDANSLASLETPVLIVGAENDSNVMPKNNFHPIKDILPRHSQYVEITEATHFSFFRICKDGAEAILANDGEEFVCDDSGNKSRPEIHAEVIDLIQAFMLE